MENLDHYGIGQVGVPWGEAEREVWLSQQKVQRSYREQVVAKLTLLQSDYKVTCYGALSCNPERYPLYTLQSEPFNINNPTVLVTGGVHGYETSGVLGALRFLETTAKQYAEHLNVIVAPCVSPWGYETINRWNNKAVDPNRSFYVDSPSQEASLLMAHIAQLLTEESVSLIAHIDLHETTDTDNTEFRPALSARDAKLHEQWDIPDGFYLVGDELNPCDDFQTAIIEKVAAMTHIAPADQSGAIIGVKTTQMGVINYPAKMLGLCSSFTQSQYNTTTEVYPDSDQVDDENCIQAQVTAINAGLDYILSKN